MHSNVSGSDGRKDHYTVHWFEDKAGNGFLGIRIFPGPQPVAPGVGISWIDPRLGIPPDRVRLFEGCRHRSWLALSDALKTILAPRALEGPNLEAAADCHPRP